MSTFAIIAILLLAGGVIHMIAKSVTHVADATATAVLMNCNDVDAKLYDKVRKS